jgi:protoporphyrinogen oxidase
MSGIVILGAGMSGFGAAHTLHAQGIKPVMYDKMSYPGGHTASFKFDPGFTFDIGPHVSFTKNKHIQDLFAESVRGEFETVSYNLNNYWKGHWITHPAHCNLYGLPTDLVVKILKDFADVNYGGEREIKNYEDWLLASYGETFARTFPMEYTAKYWTTDARNLTTDWLGPRMYRPKYEEVLFGSLSPEAPNVHYITEFRYPRRNGFGSYLTMFIDKPDLRLGHQVTGIDPKNKTLRFADGRNDTYQGLISSIALPDLIPLIEGVPTDVVEAVHMLACSSCVLVNIGVDRHDVTDAHISYFYDRDICFSRLSFPHNMSRNNVPPGTSSIQAEVYYSSKYKPMERKPADHVEPVLADLRKCGLLRPEDSILHSNYHVIPYANIIFDHDRAKALATLHGYLDDIGIAYCGRYGRWGYIWTDEAFVSGEEAAQKILETVND